MDTPVAPNRLATADEIIHAATCLRLLGDSHLASLAESTVAAEAGCFRPVVVTDFDALGDEQIVLVPAGTYLVPRRVFETPRRIIGIPQTELQDDFSWQGILSPRPRPPFPLPDFKPRTTVRRPTLLLTDGEQREFVNFDTGASTRLAVVPAHLSKFAHVVLEAQHPTILELTLGTDERFSDTLYDTPCGAQIDAYNVVTDTFLARRDWVAKALGESGSRGLDMVERGIEALNERGLKVIDAVFDPLIKIGDKIDRLLNLK